ncbi:MAG: SAM-dependent methyltransferase, partial [Paludibacter sp.]
MATLYLIPTSLGESPFDSILPARNTQIVTDLMYFIVEDVRTARRFLKKANPSIDIDTLTFFILNQHTSPEELSSFLKPMFAGNDMGVLSEAGCPAIADPG